jgi:hypothetical protein
VPVANPKAYRQNTREGDRNLNRDLREKPLPADNEDRIGNRLCALLRQHDVLLDIHSFKGEGEPFVFFGPENNTGELEAFRHATEEAAFAACLGTHILIHGWLDIYARLIAARERLSLPPLSVTEGFGTTEYMRFAGGYGVTLECGRHDDPHSADVGHAAIRNALIASRAGRCAACRRAAAHGHPHDRSGDLRGGGRPVSKGSGRPATDRGRPGHRAARRWRLRASCRPCPNCLRIGGEVLDLLLVLDAGEDHLGAGDLRLGVLDVFGEDRLVPGDAGSSLLAAE